MLHEREPNMMVDRKDLIEKLIENRDRHQERYEEMCKGYMVLVDDANEEFQALLKKEFETKEPQQVDHAALYRKAFKKATNPTEHLSDYNEPIEMLEWIEDDKIRISLSQFRQWVRDEWHWFSEFTREGELPLANSSEYNRKFGA